MTFRVICQLSLALLIGGGVGFFGKRALRTSEPTRNSHIDREVVSISVPANGSSASVRDTFGGELMNTSLANIGERLLEHHDDPMTRRLLAVRWAQEDPLGFAAFLRTLKRQGSRDGHFRSGLETILYRVWGRMNPEEAFQHALDHPWIDNNQFWGLSTVINTCAEQDFDLALQLVMKAGRRLSSYSPGPWLDASPREVIPKIARLPKCMWRGSALDDVYAQWSKARPRDALHFYTRQDGVDPLHRTAVSLAKAVAMEDPEGAMAWARSTKSSVLQTMVQRALKVLPAESQGPRPPSLRFD